mmetsp:Transcript_16408/g.23152  ORF Transcript_16408/g.23152 Transcript_16408/m.23152 type:complete len:201 (-) Transcript_16408:146-748(-)
MSPPPTFCNEDFDCQHGGYCESPGFSVCVCRSGFAGDFCEHSCGFYCLNRGHCIVDVDDLHGGVNTVYSCKCPPGYTGARCEEDVCDKDCLNGGKCIVHVDDLHGGIFTEYSCECPSGYSGAQCEKSGNDNVIIVIAFSLVLVAVLVSSLVVYLVTYRRSGSCSSSRREVKESPQDASGDGTTGQNLEEGEFIEPDAPLT